MLVIMEIRFNHVISPVIYNNDGPNSSPFEGNHRGSEGHNVLGRLPKIRD